MFLLQIFALAIVITSPISIYISIMAYINYRDHKILKSCILEHTNKRLKEKGLL